jgi:hypothetical protein
MRRGRTWLITLAVLAVVVAGILAALPIAVRELVERRAQELTGRDVTIGDVDLNLFTRRLVVTDTRVHGSPGAPAPLVLERLAASFQRLPLLRGRLHVGDLTLAGLDVYLERTEPERFNVSDILERLAARPPGEPVDAVVETLVVRGGRLRLHDRAVEPERRWVLGDVELQAHDIVTSTDVAEGRARATFVLAGAPGTLEVQRLGVRPPRAQASLTVEDLDVAGLAAYFPADAAVWLSGGRLSTRLRVDYDATGSLRAGGGASVRALTFARRGQAPPLVAVPTVAVTAREIVYAGGDLSVGGVELTAERLTVLDASAPRARPLDVTGVHAGLTLPPGPAPGRLSLSAELPRGGRLDADGTADVRPAAADLDVALRGLDVALAQIWIPADAGVQPVGGRLNGTVRVHWTPADGMVAGGQLGVERLAVAREGQKPELVRDERVVATVRDLTVRDGVLALGRVELTGAPTVTDTSVTPAQRVHLPRLHVVAEGGAVPGGSPARLRVEATLPNGGRLQADGRGGLAPASLSLRVRTTGADLGLAAPYVPPRSPVRLQQGRLDAQLSIAWDGALRAGGRLVARDLTVLRRGQSEPFIHHPALEATLTGLVLRDGQVSVERLAMSGTPTIVDATASPPQRFEVHEVALDVAGFTWPGRRPARVEGHATVADGGRGELTGTLHPGTLATDVRARFENVDVTRARGYLPADVPLVVEDGRGEVTVTLRHRQADGVRLEAEGAVRDLVLLVAAEPDVRLRDQRLSFAVTGVVVGDGTTSVGTAVVDGAPALVRGGEPAPALSRLHAELRRLRWPGGGPADWRVVAEPAAGGRVTASGTFAPDARTVAGSLEAEDASIEAFSALLPIDARVAGRLDARVQGEAGADRPAVVAGELTLRQGRLGPAGAPPIGVARVAATGLQLRGRDLTIARVVVDEPAVTIEREEDGTFPLRAMLSPESPAASPGPAARGEAPAAAGRDPAVAVTVQELVVREGNARFVDRTTTPFYSEELSRLAMTVHGLRTTGEGPATVEIQGIVGTGAALDLSGEVAPFAEPFFLDARGELRDFSVPRTNPYLQRFLDWIARRGELTTRVHYRIVGDELTATNEVLVQRLDVEPTRDEDRPDRLVGIPLGLAVALLKDARGDIRVNVPISGDLRSPQFSFGRAIRTALRNVLGRLLTAPFRAIGSVFRRDGKVDAVAIDPVTFAPGSAVLEPEAAAHLQRVADFLRSSPYVRLTLQPVISQDDLRGLRTQEVTARIQRLQREQGVEDFGEAARRLWRAGQAEGPAPEEPRAIVQALAEREPAPTEAARRLAGRRAEVTRAHLVEAAGIPPDRLLDAPGAAPVGVTAAGGVEFALRPAS